MPPAGLVAAGLLATSAAHVVVTSHVARAESFAAAGDLPVVRGGAGTERRKRPLAAAGGRPLRPGAPDLAAGPGDPARAAVGRLVAGRSLLLSHWSAVAVLGFAATYAGMLTATVREATGRGDGRVVAGGRRDPEPAGEMYLDSVGVALVAVWRILGSAHQSVAGRGRAVGSAGLAVRVAGGVGRAGAGAARPTAPAAGGALLPGDRAVRSAEADPLLNGRSLMPVAVVGIVAIGVAVGALAPIVAGREPPRAGARRDAGRAGAGAARRSADLL